MALNERVSPDFILNSTVTGLATVSESASLADLFLMRVLYHRSIEICGKSFWVVLLAQNR